MTNYVEPFFGGGSALFLRPHYPFEANRIETINDKDTYIANFWRAVQAEPEAVAYWADWPVNEADLHARHWWLVNQSDFRQKMMTEPDYYDAKIAGWWVWGICQWIGSGWCVHPEEQKRNHLSNPGQGVHRPSQKRNHLSNPGQGVHRPSQKRNHLSRGRGVHRPSQKRNHLGDPGRGDIYDYFEAIAERLRRVRVICGDWRRVLGPTPTEKLGLTGILLDPPYSKESGRDSELYSVEDLSVAHQVREWAIANGNNPLLRICLCGYEGEHIMPDNWTVVEWKTSGGYANQGDGSNVNATKERLWFSPHCLKPETVRQLELI